MWRLSHFPSVTFFLANFEMFSLRGRDQHSDSLNLFTLAKLFPALPYEIHQPLPFGDTLFLGTDQIYILGTDLMYILCTDQIYTLGTDQIYTFVTDQIYTTKISKNHAKAA